MTKEEFKNFILPINLFCNPEVVKKINEASKESQMAMLNFEKSMNESKEKLKMLRKRLIEKGAIKEENQK